MRIPKAIKGIVVTAVIALTIGSIFAYITAKRGVGRVQQVQVSGAQGLHPEPGAQVVQVSPSETPVQPQARVVRTDAMAQAFRTGKLPSPLSIPSGSPDEAAADLAK